MTKKDKEKIPAISEINSLYKLPLSVINDLQKNYPKILESVSNVGHLGSKSQDSVYATIDKAMEIFNKQLEDPNLSEESRNSINESINNLVNRADNKDTEFKKWMFSLVIVGVGGLGLSGLALTEKGSELGKTLLNSFNKI